MNDIEIRLSSLRTAAVLSAGNWGLGTVFRWSQIIESYARTGDIEAVLDYLKERAETSSKRKGQR